MSLKLLLEDLNSDLCSAILEKLNTCGIIITLGMHGDVVHTKSRQILGDHFAFN